MDLNSADDCRENAVDVDGLIPKWDKRLKEAKDLVPLEKDLVAEISGVLGALDRMKTVLKPWAKAEKAFVKAKAEVDKKAPAPADLLEALEDAGKAFKKTLILSMTSAETASKEIDGFVKLAEKLDRDTVPAKESKKALKVIVKAAEGFRKTIDS